MGFLFVVGLLVVAVGAVELEHERDLQSLDIEEFEVVPGRIEVRDGEDGERGLFAVTDFKAGSPVLRVPVERVFSRQAMLTNCPFLKELDTALSGDLNNEFLMGYCVGYMAFHDMDHQALRLLPQKCFTIETIAPQLEAHMPPGSFEKDLLWIEDEHLRYEKVIQKVASEFEIDYNTYLWGVCNVRARAFRPYGEKLLGELGSRNLLPVADLINHSHEGLNLRYLNEKDTGAWVFETTRDVKAGEELLDSYGCKSKLDMLRTYGFIPKGEDQCSAVYIDSELLHLTPDGIHYKPGVLYGEIYARVSDEIDKYLEPQGGVDQTVQKLMNANVEFLNQVIEYIDDHPGPSAHDEL